MLVLLLTNALALLGWAYVSQLRSRRLEKRLLVIILTLLGVADLAALVLWGWLENKQADWWAAWGQWLGGVGSLAAAATAVLIAQRGWRLAAIERREDLAAKFAIWVMDGPAPNFARVKFVNATQVPVYDVSVRTYGKGILFDYTALIGVLPPTAESRELDNISRAVSQQIIRTLEMEFGDGIYAKHDIDPGGRDEYGGPMLTKLAWSQAVTIIRGPLQVSVSFRLGNQRWTRLPDGHLKAEATTGTA